MTNNYRTNNYRTNMPSISTDIIIEYRNQEKEGIVLIARKNPPYGLALPGGHAEKGISLEDNAKKEAREETNLEVIIDDEERPLCVLSDPDRDPRTHMVTVVYVAKGYGLLKACSDAKEVGLYATLELMDLLGKNSFAFDHEKIIKYYLKSKGFE